MTTTLHISTIIGARPQFIKASSVSRAIHAADQSCSDSSLHESIIHTGQHFDKNMSDIFFEELDIPKPEQNLAIRSNLHGEMTGAMLTALENRLIANRPDLVMVYGDTNSTLAGSLAAAKLHIPVVHVEAGLRSFNRRMPEEINRVLTDHVAQLLFCPSELAVQNLHREGIVEGVYNVGDVMFDASLHYARRANSKIAIDQWGLRKDNYALCTIHRAENTDDISTLDGILQALAEIATSTPIILPLHPRTKKYLEKHNKLDLLKSFRVVPPVSYLEMICLESNAKLIITDSGGVQKEAFFHKVPCITLRNETEWTETVESGWNVLAGTEPGRIVASWKSLSSFDTLSMPDYYPYGDGSASEKIVKLIKSSF